VFLRQSAGPASRQNVVERFRLPNSYEGVAEDAFDELESAQRNLPVALNPITTILPKLGRKDGFRLNAGSARPTSRRSFSGRSGLPFLAAALGSALSNRRAFLGDRSKYALSMSPASSSA
jgi:hypothetical protein